jgi:hypothetical protein
LKAIYSGLASRWLHAFEAGDDYKLSLADRQAARQFGNAGTNHQGAVGAIAEFW